MYRDELLDIVRSWTLEQINNYIEELETRIGDTKVLLKELRALRRKKTRKKIVDTGQRGGK